MSKDKEPVKLSLSKDTDKKVSEKQETVRMAPLEEAKVTANCDEDDHVYRMWKEESRLVKGIFRFREPAGGNVQFYFRKYKWDPTQEYIMQDGEVYEVPLAVARHLNANCNYPIHSHILGADGKPTVDTKGRVKSRMNFEGLEFAVA